MRSRHTTVGKVKDGAIIARHTSKTSKSKKKTVGFQTLLWDEIEPWQQNNPFIIRGYRAATNSYTRSLHSVKNLHNQTVNIWSHLAGAIAYTVTGGVLSVFHFDRLAKAPTFDLLLLGQFYASIVVCLTFSSAFHTFGNHSEAVFNSFLLCDLVGIILLTTASFYPGVYYGFFCEPVAMITYCAMITVFGVASLAFCLAPALKDKSWRPYRAMMLTGMGLSGILPMTHAAIQFGIPQARLQMGWDWYLVEGFIYVAGAVIYAMKVPERWNPGLFDIWGSSHQLFHVCVLIGATCHLTGTLKAFIYNHDATTRRC